MKALALVSTPAWWVKGRRKVRASPVLQTLLLLFMLLAMFGPLLNLLIWTVAESWYFPHSLPSRWGLKYWYQVFNPYSDVSSSLLTSSKTRCASRRLRRTSLVLRQLSVRMSLAKRTHKGRED